LLRSKVLKLSKYWIGKGDSAADWSKRLMSTAHDEKVILQELSPSSTPQ
jgi:hypothetical protein